MSLNKQSKSCLARVKVWKSVVEKDGNYFDALDMEDILSKHLYYYLESDEGFQDALVNGVVRRP